jgi:hypothetical protein
MALLDKLLELRAKKKEGETDESQEARLACAMFDCRCLMKPEEEAKIEGLVAERLARK